VDELSRVLRRDGLLLLDAVATSPFPDRGLIFRFRQKRQVLEVTRALAALLAAGLPLAQALSAASNMASGGVSGALAKVKERVERGDHLAEALSAHPQLFSPLYVGLARAGERSANLPGAFARLSSQLERHAEFRSRLLSASIYPLVLATLGGLAVLLLVTFVIPRFADILSDSGAALPRSTAIVLGLATAVREGWPFLVLGGLALVLVVATGWATERGQRLRTAVMLRLPLVRSLAKDILAGQFARMIGTLLAGGAPLLEALEDGRGSMADPLARDETDRIRARVREGVALHSAIEEGGFFPSVLSQLSAVGVESGRLPDFLLKAADLFEERTETTLQRLVTLAEPAMIVAFGCIIGPVALAMLQAIYSVNAGAFR
jgi:type II secretory pathway component PulF